MSETQSTQTTVLATLPDDLAKAGVVMYRADKDAREATVDASALTALVKPTEVILNRDALGYSRYVLSGDGSDDGVARLLASSLKTTDDIAKLMATMKSGTGVSEIVHKMLPRADVPLRGRKAYSIHEQTLAAAVAAQYTALDAEIQATYVHIFGTVFGQKSLLAAPLQKHVIGHQKNLLASVSDITRASFVDKMRGIFDTATIVRWASSVPDEVTPSLLADHMIELMQTLADTLPTVARDLRDVNLAMGVLRMYVLAPEALPKALEGDDNLRILTKYANLVLHVVNHPTNEIELATSEVYQLERALANTVKLIAGASDLETMSLERYTDSIFMVPAAAMKGEARGVVAGRLWGQDSKNIVVEAMKDRGYWTLTEQDPTDVVGSTFAPKISNSFLTVNAFSGVLNIMADTLAERLVAQGSKDPELWTFQLSETDVTLMAIRASRTLMVLKSGNATKRDGKGSAKHRIVYVVPVKGDWRAAVSSSTGAEATFNDAASAVIYSYDMDYREGAAMSQRSQTLNTAIMQRRYFANDVTPYLSSKVAKPYKQKISVSGQEKPIEISFTAIAEFLTKVAVAHDRDTYSYVREPAVDAEIRAILAVIAYFIDEQSNSASTASRAASWIMEQSVSIWDNDVVISKAAVSLLRGCAEAGLDLRRVTHVANELAARVLMATALGLLERFEKADPTAVATIVTKMPSAAITAAASQSLQKMQSLMRR